MLKQTPPNREPAGSAHRSRAARVFLAVWGLVTLPAKVFSYTRVGAGRLRVGMSVSLVAVTALAVLAVGFGVKPEVATAAPANTINFQARLQTASGAIAGDGFYNVRFKLYNVSTGGSALWTETYLVSSSQGIRSANGYLTANLGSVTAFPSGISWGQQLYLTMEVGGTGSSPSWDGEMSPRLAMTSVPSAFALNSYNSANGFSSSLSILQPTGGNQIFQIPDQGAAGTYNVCIVNSSSCGFASSSGNGNYIQNQFASAQTSSNFWISGTGRAATALQAPAFDSISAGNLNIGTTNATSITLGKSGVNTIVAGNLSVGTTSSYGAITIANGAWLTALDSAGTGYVNMLSVNGNNEIQVGAALNIDGGIVLPTDGGQMTFSDLPISSSALAGTAQSYTLRVGSSNALTVYGEADGAGNAQNIRVAIGSSITPAYTLDVGGDVNTSGTLRIGGTSVITAARLLQNVTGISTSGVISSTVATGTAPLTIASTTKVANLNADLLDGLDSSVFCQGSCLAGGSASGDLTGTYPSPTVAKLQGSTLTLNTPTSGNILQFNGTAWVNQAVSGDISISSTGVAAIAAGSIVNADLAAGSFTNITAVGTLTGLTVNGSIVPSAHLNGSQNLGAVGNYWGSIYANDLEIYNSTGVGISTSGSDLSIGSGKLFVQNSTSRVGIGTTAPVTTLDVNGSISTSQNGVRTYHNVYSSGSSTPSITGTLEIILPTTWNNTMAKFTISGYDYSTNAAWTAVVSGYNYSSSPAWINTSAEIRGAPAPFNSVRLAYDSVTGKNVLLLGTTSTVWSYPQFSITEVVAGFTGRDAWGGSYSSSFLTSETNITNVNSPSTQVAAYGQVFLQGGNSFAANAILGTNDNYSLTFETNSVNRLSIDTSGNVNLLTGALQVGSTTVITSGRVLQNVTYNGGTVGVGYGGTGVTSFTQYGILFGNNTGSLGVTGAGTTGQCLVATTAGAPAWGTCSGTGSGVTLQAAYNNSLGGTTPEIVLDAAKGTLDVQAYSGQTADLLNLRAYASTGLGVSRFSVTAAGAVTSAGGLTVQSGGASITGGFNNNNGNISNAGSLSGVTGITTSGGYTQSGTGTNTFTGAINASSINATGTVNSANSRSANYTSLTGASGDWFPLFTLSDNTHGMVTVNLKTYAHSSVSFTVGQGYGPGNTARINVLNAVSSTNGGYANITGIRVLQSGAVEIRLTWSTGPTVNVSAQIIGTTATPDPVTSLVTSASASPQVDAVTSLSSGLIRGGGNLEIQGNINTSGALMTGAVTRISSTGAGTLTTLQLTGVLTSTVATGTAPLTVASTTKVTNLNADLLDGLDSSSFLQGTITADDVTARINSGFYQTATATIAEGYPQDTNSWYHLLSSTHSNTGNYYAMQFAGSFYNSNDLFYRSTNGNGATGWNRIWHQGNDGASSGLDADTLDGIDSSAFITTASGSGNYIQNGTALQAASFNISGTGSISSTLNVNGYIQGNSKPIIQTTDGWLRLNPTNAFTSGIYANTGIFRTDGTLQVGSSGATLNVVSGGNFAYNTNTLFANTAGNVGIGTAAPTAGYKLDVQGAALIKTSSTSAFRIQDASNNSLLTADTTNLRLTVGTAIIKDTITNVSTFTNGSWTAGTTFAGASATSLIAADLNGDGVQDLLTRNNGTFGVHLNGGTGTLSSLSYTSAGTTGNAVAADIDGDGDKDVLVANTTTTVSLYKNDGTGTFAASGTVTFSNAIASIVMADLDGDGDQDIVAVGSTSSSGWAYVGLNNGTGTSYSISTVTSAVAYAKQVVIADINNDGNKDILIANSNAGTVSTFKNNGNATFATRVDVTVGSTITAITTTDIENDNDQDIVVTYGTTSGVLATLANNGTGTFATPLVYTTSTYPAFLVADDINADGYNDIVVGASGMVAVHRNSGLGSFGARSQYTGGGSSSFAVTLLDGDKDGDIDIAAGNTTAGGTVFWNDGIEFVTPVTQNLRASVQVAMTKPGDIGVLTQAAVGQTANLYQANDSDGNLLMAVSAEGKLSVGGAPVSYSITTVSDGTLTPDTMKTDIYAGVSGPRYNILNDFDGDGDKDIVTMNTYLNYSSDYYNCSLSIFKNNGDGTYGTRTDFAANSANNSSACYTTFGSADFDGDGDKDLAVIYSVNGSTATVYLYLNNGSGTFTAGTNYTAPFSYYYTEMAFADVDGDGDQDMAIGGNGGVSVYKNNGNATFAAAVVSSASSRVTGVKFADLDGDGDQDMAVASFADYPSNTAYLDVFKNNGTGTFTKASNTAGSRSWGITVGDYDGDGDIDIAMAIGGTSGDATTVRIYKNPGNGTFSTGTNFTGAGNTLSTGDLDGDGDQDILGSGGAVYRNDGTGAFGSFKTYINFPSGGSSVTGATTIGDIDGDGDNDLVSTYFAWNWTGSYVYTHTVYVLKNFGADSIGAAYAGAGAAHVYAANLNNDAYKDLVTNDAKGFTTHFRNANGTHTSTSYTVSSTNYVVVDAAPGDIDGDGDTDVVMAYYDSTSSMYGYIAIYKNNGSGVFTLFSTSNPGGYPYGLREILVDDLNGDGTAEIYSLYAYYSSPNYNVNVYAGTASGSSSLYSSSPNSSTDPNRMHLASGDFNNDGNKDLYVTTGLNLAVLRNNGSSITTTQLASDTTLATGSEIVVADVNRDGWKDVVLASYATATLNVLLNNNGTSFGSILIYNATKTTNSIINTSSADFDGDGDIDILAGSVLYKNNGLGNYGERVQTSIPAGTTAPMSIADFDGDGDIDIARDGTFYWSASGSYGTTTTSMISVRSTDATSGGLFIQGAINQTAKLFVIQDAKGSALLTVDGNGNLRVKGAITGGVGSPDYAENITVSDPMIEAADVVSMDPGKKESVVRSSVPYDDTAVGVISTSPGFVTNASESEEPDETQRPLALSGRVPVKVTDENGVIVEGDYLTTSSTPGYAMKATKEGHVIGRAMATFTGTEADVTECVADLACGKVLMFIDNSYYSPVDGSNLQANDMTLFGNMGIGGNAVIGGGLDVAQNLNVGGLASLNGLKVTGNANIDGNLTVKGTANVATLKVGKHILSGSDTPLVAIGSAAGQDGLVTIDGTDVAGTLNITVKARPGHGNTPDEVLSAGSLADVTFKNPYEFTPRIVISPTNQTSMNTPVYLVKTNTGWQLMIGQTAVDGAVYQFDYVIVGSQGQSTSGN